jgi:hypothetical protein
VVRVNPHRWDRWHYHDDCSCHGIRIPYGVLELITAYHSTIQLMHTLVPHLMAQYSVITRHLIKIVEDLVVIMSNIPTASCGCAFSCIPAPSDPTLLQLRLFAFCSLPSCTTLSHFLFKSNLLCGKLSNNRAICSKTQSKHPNDRLALWTSLSNASNDLTFHFPCLSQASAMPSIWDPPQQDPSLWRLPCAADSHAQKTITRINVHCIV